MLRDVILKHFLRLVYMRSAWIYIFVLVLPVLGKAQGVDLNKTYSTVNFADPQVGQFIRFYEFWSGEGPGLIISSESIVDSLALILRKNLHIIWEVGRFSDCRASAEYNLNHTTKRAAELRKYLIEKGVDSSKITFKGYGESKHLNNCECNRVSGDLAINCTEEQHSENRRTELRIIAIEEAKNFDKCFDGFSYPEDSTFTYLKHLTTSENRCPEVIFFYWQNPDAYVAEYDWKAIFVGDKNNIEYSYSQWDTSKPVLLQTRTINRYRKVLASIKNEPRCSDGKGEKSFLMIIHIKDGVYTCYNVNYSIQIDEDSLLDYIFKNSN